MVVFPALQLPPFLSPAHIAIRSATFPPVQSVSSQLQLAGFMVLCRPAGSFGVWEAQELWAHRDKAFNALGPTCQSPPQARCMEKKNYQGQYADHMFILLLQIPKFPCEICWELFRVKRQRLFSNWLGKDHMGTVCRRVQPV